MHLIFKAVLLLLLLHTMIYRLFNPINNLTVWQVDLTAHGWVSSVGHHVAAAICWSTFYPSEPLISLLLVTDNLKRILKPLCVPLFSFSSTRSPSLCLCFRSLLRLAGFYCLLRVTHTQAHLSTHTMLK